MAERCKHHLPATEVKNRFGQVLREVARTGGPIIVERDGRPVAVILSIEAFDRLRPRAETSDRRALAQAAFGMWSERTDINDEWLELGRSRWQSEWAIG
jgi:prevent-host-death family protein